MRAISHILLPVAVIAALGIGASAGQKKTKAYTDLPIIQPKEKDKKDQMRSEVLPAVKEPPGAVSAATSRLTFEAAPLTGRGLLSAQVRETLRALVRNAQGATVVKLRAFVAGSGDLRRVPEIAAEVFGERKQPLPALSVVLVGALPLEGAQVSIEATLEGRRDVNPSGLAFVAAQPGNTVPDALQKVRLVLDKANADEVLRATCFVSSLEPGQGTPAFGGINVVLVQMAREPVPPSAACEAVARLRSAPAQPVQILSDENGRPAAALVSAPRLALSGIQLGFGKQDSDIALVLDRLDKALAAQGSGLRHMLCGHAYLMSGAVADPLRRALERQTGAPRPATALLFEGLSSIDAVVGLDVTAVAGQ